MDLFVVEPRFYQKAQGQGAAGLKALSAFNRINALSCIKSAEHGWLGASYSIAEILTVLYHALDERNVVLSKGHAAAMQYACLFGLGMLSREQLLSYKNGPGSPQAHASLETPGVLLNTGSLGQALSKTAALAVCRPDQRFYVVVGDGELQEGQVFEGLQTVSQRCLHNLTVIVDVNGFQTEDQVEKIKSIPEPARLLEALGFAAQSVDGHDPQALLQAFRAVAVRPKAILARTEKAGGSKFLRAKDGRQPWHARVPDDALTLCIQAEQVVRAAEPELARAFEVYAKPLTPDTVCREDPPALPRRAPATRDGFSAALERLLGDRPELAVLDADLGHSCGLDRIRDRREQFFEMGIAEQDMVSFAGGLALAGRLPVVNTYAAFYKRAVEQLFVNLTEGKKVLYAGHYAGLDYFTDGKTHQSLNDLSLMRALPGLVIVEPVTPEHAGAALEWAAGPQVSSVYFRLRRLAAELDLGQIAFHPERPLTAGKDFRRCFFTTGTVSTRLALDCQRSDGFRGWGVVVQSVFGHPIDRDFYRDLLKDTVEIVSIEEDLAPGTLNTFVRGMIADLGLPIRVRGKALDRLGHSFRRLEDCLAFFGFTVEGIRSVAGLDP